MVCSHHPPYHTGFNRLARLIIVHVSHSWISGAIVSIVKSTLDHAPIYVLHPFLNDLRHHRSIEVEIFHLHVASLDSPPRKAKSGLHSAANRIEKKVLAMSVVAYHLSSFDSSSYCSSSMSGMAALNGSMTSFRPWHTTVSVHCPLDFYTGYMRQLKGERALPVTPWFSGGLINLWMEIEESQLVRYCCWCTIVIQLASTVL